MSNIFFKELEHLNGPHLKNLKLTQSKKILSSLRPEKCTIPSIDTSERDFPKAFVRG